LACGSGEKGGARPPGELAVRHGHRKTGAPTTCFFPERGCVRSISRSRLENLTPQRIVNRQLLSGLLRLAEDDTAALRGRVTLCAVSRMSN